MYSEIVRHLPKGVDGNVVVATAVAVVTRYEVTERAPALPARRLSLELRRLEGADAIQPSSPTVAAWSELQLVSS